MYEEIFGDYQRESEVSQELIQKYESKLPEEWLQVWKELGFGTFMNGFFRIINPDDYQDVLQESYYDYLKSTPIMMTAFGDLIVWVENDCGVTLFYDAASVHVLFVDFEMLFFDLEDREYFVESRAKDGFLFQLYEKALAKFGPLEKNQCFGFETLLCEGGKKTLSNVAVLDAKEYMNLNIEATGGVYEKPGPRWKKAGMSAGATKKDKKSFDGKDHSGVFGDFNFKLIVVEALLDKKADLKEALKELQAKYGEGVAAFQMIPEVANYIADLVLTQEDLEMVEQLYFDGGNEIYQLLTTEWDGEDALFDVTNIQGYEKLSKLKKVYWASMCEPELLAKMEENGIDVSY